MIFSTEGYRWRTYRQYQRLLRLSAQERYKVDELLKQRMRALGFDLTMFYPPAGEVTADDVTYYADSTTITADGAK